MLTCAVLVLHMVQGVRPSLLGDANKHTLLAFCPAHRTAEARKGPFAARTLLHLYSVVPDRGGGASGLRKNPVRCRSLKLLHRSEDSLGLRPDFGEIKYVEVSVWRSDVARRMRAGEFVRN